jgi:protein-tyrosine phosphatase
VSYRVLIVCMGNICRSPTAEAVLRQMVADAGAQQRIEVDSAGTGAWHVGEPADPRARSAAARRGYRLDGVARAVTVEDFDEFDLIVSVDEANLIKLRRMAPAGSAAQVRMLADTDVPDPYYGGADGFDQVLDLVETACRDLLAELLAQA